jgi:hypothetical protein
MLFTELIRLTVLLAAGAATALGAVSVVAADRLDESATLILAAVWWTAAVVAGVLLGRSSRTADSVRRVLAGARTTTTLPDESPGRVAIARLWPIGVFALLCAGLAWSLPQVSVIGAGYAILVALAWRRREAAICAIEDRDGVRFYVEPAGAFRPVRLVRTPGLGSDRLAPGHPPPPPPAQ